MTALIIVVLSLSLLRNLTESLVRASKEENGASFMGMITGVLLLLLGMQILAIVFTIKL